MANLPGQEVDDLLYVYELDNTFRMTRYIQLWSADLQGNVGQQDVLVAVALSGLAGPGHILALAHGHGHAPKQQAHKTATF
jgi:hypothetical protein